MNLIQYILNIIIILEVPMKISADAVKLALVNKNWRIKDLVKASGVSHNTISGLLNHDKVCNPFTVGKIVAALEINAEEIVKKEDN